MKAHPVILVAGSGGMLGSELVLRLGAMGITTAEFDLPTHDIRNVEDLAEAMSHADLVINCAAYTNVDLAEKEPETAFAINSKAVGCMGAIAARSGKYVLHIGTDFVFDGGSGNPYSEDDHPKPLNVYGRSKLAGESMLRNSGCRHAIVRVQWTYGVRGSHFVRKLLERASASNRVGVVDDQVGSPTWVKYVADVLCRFVDTQATGVYHYSSAGYASRFDVARFILEEMKMDCEVVPCKTADFPSVASRPLNSRFNCSKIDSLLGGQRKHWQDMMTEFLHIERWKP